MPYKIVWFDKASYDLENIYRFYFVKSPNAANKIYNSILDETDILSTHPNIAPIESYLEGKSNIFRSLVTKDGLFKIVYSVDNDNEEIVITRIWCCRSDPKTFSS